MQPESKKGRLFDALKTRTNFLITLNHLNRIKICLLAFWWTTGPRGKR